MTARVLVIGLDAAEATLVERWAAEGVLPTFARLTERGVKSRLANPMETLPGAIWSELVTGISCGKRPHYYHPHQLVTGDARAKQITPAEIDTEGYYWVQASNAGRRVAVIDQVQTVRAPGLNGIQLFEWGIHDRHYEECSEPPELLSEIGERYGEHPVRSCDDHGNTEQGYETLRQNLLDAVDLKTKLLLDLMEREHWDLFTCAFTEFHCVGHQFWHFQDPRHPWYDRHDGERFRDTIRDIYIKVDQAIARVIEAAGDETTVVVFCSHGMGPYIDGPQLLPEVLVRLGMASAGHSKASYLARRMQAVLRSAPRRWHQRIKRMKDFALVRKAQSAAGNLYYPLESPQTRVATLRNNRVGALRLNLKGREPFGCVEPGAEAAALTDELRRELMALEDPATGRPIVKAVVSAEEAFGPDHHPDVPDLMVVFRTDGGPIEACRSPRVGLIKIPINDRLIPRSGDHTVESRLWAVGPGIAAGVTLPEANVLDLAPTVLALLDVPVSDGIDGRPIPGVTNEAALV
jgi:predicted AlkP superfamily phosphohydrolase/phosphomutase